MCGTRVLLLLIMLVAPGWIAGCSRLQAGHPASVPPYVPPDISQEALNSLVRQNSSKLQPALAQNTRLWAHEVRNRRETLFSIAEWYTGSGNNWRHLIDANPGIDPRKIRIGDTILIPENLLKTRDPMPVGRSRPKRSNRKSKKQQPSDNHPPAKKEEPALFGPIVIDTPPHETGESQLPVPLETISP